MDGFGVCFGLSLSASMFWISLSGDHGSVSMSVIRLGKFTTCKTYGITAPWSGWLGVGAVADSSAGGMSIGETVSAYNGTHYYTCQTLLLWADKLIKI